MLFEIHADNLETVLAFLALSTQWRVIAGMGGGGRLGIEYASIPVVLRYMVPAARRREAFEGVRVMEAAALPILNKRTEKAED